MLKWRGGYPSLLTLFQDAILDPWISLEQKDDAVAPPDTKLVI